jgi:acetylornithine deacetylase/succinyl-diaminopimelate desuccinylase-like protein
MAQVRSTADLLSQLVACRSDATEAALADLLARLVRPWGARVTVQAVLPGRPNFIATLPGHDESRSLLLEAHSDTVPGEGQYTPTIREGRLHGRGACDTKGAMAAMLLAIETVLAEAGRPPITLHFVSTCNEELGAAGAHHLMRSGFRADWAVVGEPTELAIVYAHKGALRLRLRAEGKAAHSSTPGRGDNAIYKMCAVVAALEKELAPRLAGVHHADLGSPTLSVGTIRGGSQVNVVPDWCEIEVDRRLVPGEEQHQVIEDLVGLLPGDCGYTVTEYYPPLSQSLTSPLVRRMLAAVGESRLATAPWASNAGVFAAAGIPSILFGPGSIRQAHTNDEYVELAQVEAASRVYADLIRGCVDFTQKA